MPTVNCCEDSYYRKVMKWAARYNRMTVLSKIRNKHDLLVSRVLGAQGVGTFLTDDMFSRTKEHLRQFQAYLLSDDINLRADLAMALTSLMYKEFLDVFRSLKPRWYIGIQLLNTAPGDYLPKKDKKDSFCGCYEEEVKELVRICLYPLYC